MTNPYSILGVSQGASPEEIKKAFRKRALTCHPDVTATESAAVQKAKAVEYRQLREAYESLTGGGRGSRTTSSYASSSGGQYQHTGTSYYRADGGYRRHGQARSRPSFSWFATRTARAAQNSWQNGGVLVLSGVFFAGMMAFEPMIEGWWEARNAGKLFKDIHAEKES